jgi:hypothetical protein
VAWGAQRLFTHKGACSTGFLDIELEGWELNLVVAFD